MAIKHRKKKKKFRSSRKTPKNKEVMISMLGPNGRKISSTVGQTIAQASQLHQQGKLVQAEKIYRLILAQKDNYFDAQHSLAILCLQCNRPLEALEFIDKAVKQNPHSANAFNYRGLALDELKRFDEAILSYDKAIKLKPDYAEAYNNMGTALDELKRFDEAILSYDRAIKLKPDYAEAYNNMGTALDELKRFDEAILSYDKAIKLKPDYAETYNNCGEAYRALQKYDIAIARYEQALALKPDYVEAYSNLGVALQELGRMEEAIARYEQALALKPDYVEAHCNLGFTLLNKGRLKEGLDEHEWRLRSVKFDSRKRYFSKPLWDGFADLKGRTILLWGEQGPQDMTIWSSCLTHMSTRAGHCILECPLKLVPLFTRSFPDVEVRPENCGSDIDRDDFDFHLPMGSLFRYFLQNLSDVSEVKAFLIPDLEKVAFWKKRLGEIGSGPFVGISWKSPLMTPERSPNYTELADWASTFANREAVFVNLQCKDYEDDLTFVKRNFGVTVYDFEDLNLYDDLDEVAALSAALDVAISVSTAVAAITAGVGTPTWVITWRQSSWNNFLYAPRGPSVRFFERDTGESWDAVFASIAECLVAKDF